MPTITKNSYNLINGDKFTLDIPSGVKIIDAQIKYRDSSGSITSTDEGSSTKSGSGSYDQSWKPSSYIVNPGDRELLHVEISGSILGTDVRSGTDYLSSASTSYYRINSDEHDNYFWVRGYASSSRIEVDLERVDGTLLRSDVNNDPWIDAVDEVTNRLRVKSFWFDGLQDPRINVNGNNTAYYYGELNRYEYTQWDNFSTSYLQEGTNNFTFYSDKGEGDVYVEVTYNEPPGVPTLEKPNGGETWNDEHQLSILAATDAEGDSLTYEYQLSTDNGTTWDTILNTISTNPTYNFINESESSTCKVRVRAYDGHSYGEWDESDGVFTIQHNQAPNEPDNLEPNGGNSLDNTSVIRLSWEHNDPNSNDPQSQFDIQWRLQGNSTWNVISRTTTNNYFDVSADVFPVGDIEWRVRTYDQESLSSPYSETAVFTASEPSNAPTIIEPDSVVTIANPTVQWSSANQVSYQIVIENSLNEIVWDTGEVNNSNKAQTVGIDLNNGGQYKVKVRVKDIGGIWSEYATKSIEVSYTPPTKPTLSTSSFNGGILLRIHNPTPSGTQPTVTYNEVFKKIDGEWVRIVTGLPSTTDYTDYAVAKNQVYEYYVRALGDNGTISSSDKVSNSTTFRGVWLHNIQDPLNSIYNFKYDKENRSSNWKPDVTFTQFAGRKHKVSEFSLAEDDVFSVTLELISDEEVDKLEDIIKAKDIVCCRDGRGRLLFGIIASFPLTDTDIGYKCNLTVRAIDYTEAV